MVVQEKTTDTMPISKRRNFSIVGGVNTASNIKDNRSSTWNIPSVPSTRYGRIRVHQKSPYRIAQHRVLSNLNELTTFPTPIDGHVIRQITATLIEEFAEIAWLHRKIAGTTSEDEIIALLRDADLEHIADRLVYLQECVADDPEEEPMDLESLKQFASFIMSERQLRQPRIGVNPDGLIQTEWELPTDGVIAMNFLPSGFIEFAAISAPATHKVQRIRVSGTLAKDDALRALAPFFSRLTHK